MKPAMAEASLLIKAFNGCRARLKAFIRGRAAGLEDAEDIFQEISYQLMKVEQPVENVAAWLFRAARNEMTDRARKKREVPFATWFSAAQEDDFAEDELAETLFGVAQTPEEEYLKQLLWAELEVALAELTPAQRDAFVKTELEGYSVKALAEQNGDSVQAILSRKHKAVLYLRTRLRNLYDELAGD